MEESVPPDRSNSSVSNTFKENVSGRKVGDSDSNSNLDYNVLVTRASKYNKYSSNLTSVPEHRVMRSQSKKDIFLKCKTHNPQKKQGDFWGKNNNSCKSCIKFDFTDEFQDGKLPTVKKVLEYLITLRLLRDNNKGKRSISSEYEVATDLVLHWIFCNVYTCSVQVVQKKLKCLFQEYERIKDYAHSKKGETYWKDYDLFCSKQDQLFDIIANKNKIKSQEKLWSMKMSSNDYQFYENQKQTPAIGHCTNFVDRKREISQKQMKKQGHYSSESSSYILEDSSQDDSPGKDYIPALKKAKYEFSKLPTTLTEDDMPERLQNVRSGLRSVKDEIYMVMAKLKSSHHMSQKQCEAAVIEVSNRLFERDWKIYDKNFPTDKNTLPAGSNLRRIEPYLEVMALGAIVQEIMESGNATVMYANDGSAMSGVGNYVVQSLTINGVQRVLPSFSIFTETRESLHDLEVMTLNILCAAVGYRYSEKQILEHVDFVMTDSTSHNLTVMESVCEKFDAAPPKSLTCNMHPLMMFQRQVTSVFRQIHDSLGKEKILDCFMVDVDFASEDFISKSIRCLISFINKDFSAKPWNRQKHFDEFIKPKKNETVPFKDQRFNRLFECCIALIHHLDDIANFLEKYKNVVNNISILDRSFVQMSLLKPIFCAVALTGIHITKPYEAFLNYEKTKYSNLLEAFPVLYQELCHVDPAQMLKINDVDQVFKFVNNNIFKITLPKQVVRDSIKSCVSEYSAEIINVLNILLPNMAKGFSTQKGALFAFGPNADNDTNTLFKVGTATESDLEKLNKASTTNLGEERSVGMLNYELKIRGKANFEAASRKVLLHKSFDLMIKKNTTDYKKFRKPAKEVQQIKVKWNAKMQERESAGYSQKDIINSQIESTKYNDLEYLKNNGGPFTKPEEVDNFMESFPESKQKNKRLYIEVRYAKNTCISLKHSSSVFTLRRKNRNLASDEYASNIREYLGDARHKTSLTIEDLTSVLERIRSLQIVGKILFYFLFY